ncbi:hypothetical protein [Sagittula sp. S175]|uniref:hypothetical protein n=1 Tax=Sagittula sp. S175 TaxID=3415129 RepID=UPI003C79DE14
MQASSATQQPVHRHHHDHEVRGRSDESVGHRAKVERQEGERQGDAASRIARGREYGGDSYSAVVSAVFVSFTMTFAAVSVTGRASDAAEPAAAWAAEATEVSENDRDADDVVVAAPASGDVAMAPSAEEATEVAESDGDADDVGAAAQGYQGAAMFVSAQMTYTSASIALALLQK